MPLDRREVVGDFLGLLVIDADGIVLPRRAEAASRRRVVQGHDVVALLCRLENLLARFGRVLEEVPVGVGNQQDGSSGAAHLVEWPPAEGVDWPWVLGACVDLSYFIIGAEVEDADEAVTVSAGSHGVLVVELDDHKFRRFWNYCLHQYLVLQRYLLNDPTYHPKYL